MSAGSAVKRISTHEEGTHMMVQDQLFAATAMPDRDWWQTLWSDPDAVVKALGVKRGMEVIDLGCGYGYFTAAIARQIDPGHVIGIDLDPEMLEQARAACKATTNCIWRFGDARNLSHLIANPVDFVLIANSLHGVPDKTALATEVAATLRPTGRIAIVNWYPIAREQTPVLGQPRGPSTQLRMSPEQTRVVVEPAGFELETLVELPPYHYGAIFVRSGERRK